MRWSKEDHPTGIRLSFEITCPLGPDDKDLLTGVSIMTLAIADHEMAKERSPETFPDDETDAMAPSAAEATQADCGARHEERVCVAESGHEGRHRFRPLVKNGMN